MAVFAGYFIYQLYEYAPVTPDNVCESAAVLLTMGITTCCIGWFAWQFLNFYNRAQVVTVSQHFLTCSTNKRKYVISIVKVVFEVLIYIELSSGLTKAS